MKIVIAALAATLLASAAYAGELPLVVRHAKVSYADLDLKKAEGITTLKERLMSAALRVCPTGPRTSLDDVLPARVCREIAYTNAINEVHTRLPEIALAN